MTPRYRWNPERTSRYRGLGDAVRYGEGLGNVARSEKVGAQVLLDVFDRDGEPLPPLGIAEEVLAGFERAMDRIEEILESRDLVAARDGLRLELLVRIDGKAWPAIPGVTTRAETTI